MTRLRRAHDDGATQSEAEYSPCETYRYQLSRSWDARGRRLLYIMLNPSKATEAMNDPTVERCERRARRLGYGAFRVCNVFAYRETDPALLKRAPDPVGPDNDACLLEAVDWADDILCAWGVHGVHLGRHRDIEILLSTTSKPLSCLGATKDGHPRHPLYVRYAQGLLPWRGTHAAAI